MKPRISFLILTITFITTGCSFYKVGSLKVIDSESIINQQKTGDEIVIHDEKNGQLYSTKNLRKTEDNRLFTPTYATYQDSKAYSKYGEVHRYKKNQQHLTQQTHLYLKEVTMSDSTSLSFDYELITDALVYRKAKGLTAASKIATGAGITVAASTIFLIIACSCPHVYVDQNQEQMVQGSLFPGAVYKSLEREDFLICENITPSNTIDFTVANELNEDQYIDLLELRQVERKGYETLGLNKNSSPIYLGKMHSATKAISANSRDILKPISEKDGMKYEFSDSQHPNDFNSIELTFSTNDLKDQSQLVIKGKQTNWLNQVVSFTYAQMGEEFQSMGEKIEKRTNVDRNKKNFARKGISLNAFVKINNNWKELGTFHHAGTFEDRTLSIPIDLSSVSGNEVEIKLTCAHRMWELDYVGVTDQWSEDISYSVAPITSAFNDKGEDVSSLILNQDEQYSLQHGSGTWIQSTFETKIDQDYFYVIRSKGYYKDLNEYTGEPNKKLLRKYPFTNTVNQVSKYLDHQISVAQKTSEK